MRPLRIKREVDQVELQIRGNDVAITNGLREFANDRIGKLDHLLGRFSDAHLELRKLHNRQGGDVTRAQLTLRSGTRLLRAEEEAHDPGRAIDLVVEKMARQVRRFHDKRTKRKGVRSDALLSNGADIDEQAAIDAITEEDDDFDVATKIVRTKRFLMKPMVPAEAVEQMELLGHEFFLFLNAEEAQLNVIYRRRDGNYGVIAPDLV
jgi:putative sigma-54 modulation protein